MSEPLTREQVERACVGLLNDSLVKGQIGLTTTIVLLSTHDAAQRALLRQREEALELVMATCDNKDWYMARQGESFEAMRHHGITLEAQLAAMNAEAEEVSGEALQRCLSLEQQLAAMTAERDAFIQGGVTEDLLRKCDGFIKVGRGCVLVRDDDYAQLTQQLAASQARCAQLEEALSMWTQHYAGRLYGDADLPEIFAKSIVALTPTERLPA